MNASGSLPAPVDHCTPPADPRGRELLVGRCLIDRLARLGPAVTSVTATPASNCHSQLKACRHLSSGLGHLAPCSWPAPRQPRRSDGIGGPLGPANHDQKPTSRKH